MATETKLKGILESIGFSDKEAAVYMAALKLGQATALDLSKATGIVRGTIYNIVDSLMKRGMMSESLHGKRKFIAESPEKLHRIIEERERTFTQFLPDYMTMYQHPTTEQDIKSYQGKEGIRSGLELMLSDLRPGDYYLVIANINILFDFFPKWFPTFLEKRATYNINLQSILQDGPQSRNYKKFQKNYNDTVKLLPKNVDFLSNIVITNHRVLLPQIKPNIGAIVLENKQVVDTQTKLFHMIWDSLPDEK